jgi:hypothetical protein
VGDAQLDSQVIVDFVGEEEDQVRPSLAWNATQGGLDLSFASREARWRRTPRSRLLRERSRLREPPGKRRLHPPGPGRYAGGQQGPDPDRRQPAGRRPRWDDAPDRCGQRDASARLRTSAWPTVPTPTPTSCRRRRST